MSGLKPYHDLLQETLEKGIKQFNERTGKLCYVLVGRQLTFDLNKGFPAVTTKKLAFNAVKGELLGFFRGYDNAADFRSLNCKIWDQNANETKAWLDNPNRKCTDDLGRIYGVQWTRWSDKRVIEEKLLDDYEEKGYKYLSHLYKNYNYPNHILIEREINQLENALYKLITDPSDRRIIVSGWNIAEFDKMSLPPCHVDYRFVALNNENDNRKTLHVVMTIRSWDEFLGGPFNIASTALFLSIMARLADMDVGTMSMQATNVHIYEDHIEQVKLQLSREEFPLPKLFLSDSIKPIKDIKDIIGAFDRIEPEYIQLEDYQSHDSIKAPMAT